jgi:sulfite exporter TauE/SafE
MSGEYSAIVLTAFMAGLLGSGHCFAMCGGIAGSLGTMAAGQGGRPALFMAAQFNFGRMLAYGLAGLLSAGLLGGLKGLAGLQILAPGLRLVTAIMVLLIGLRYLFDWRGIDRIERWGSQIWKKISPQAARFASRPGPVNRLMLGMCWGFLPCGLVYTMLLTAASTANAPIGAGVMIAFGLGTMPSMLGLTLATPSLAAILRDRDFRRFIGLSLVLLAAWMCFSIFSMGGFTGEAAHSMHQH